jgi:malate dehydrogenase (quinone)
MTLSRHVENPDVVLVGSGIMSATLGAMLKRLDPALRIQLYEVSRELAPESSNGWNNAGTGHAGICELSYTPGRNPDGTVDVQKAIEIFEQFEYSKQFWRYAVESGMATNPREFINAVPHMSFVNGAEQVAFLRARHKAMIGHHFFRDMEFSTDRETIALWAPLLVEGRGAEPVAATKMAGGTDVNFGNIAQQLAGWLSEQEGCAVATGHRVVGLSKISGLWEVTVRDTETREIRRTATAFVFVGAGGGSLELLQAAGIAESKGMGGFPIGGQWLVCDRPEIVRRHQAKVYGQALGAAPTMAVPHLDTRVLDGKKALLFGPFASFTTKFLHGGGSWTDLPRSIRPDNVATLIRIGLHNIPLVKYLVEQGTQSMADRMEVLRIFYPAAVEGDWRLVDAGIRVQAIKKTDGEAGIVHYGTEVISTADRSLSALLGASPGASVSAHIVLQVIRTCFGDLLASDEGRRRLKEMIPCHDEDLKDARSAARYRELNAAAEWVLRLV